MAKKKDITINELADIVKAGFANVDKKFIQSTKDTDKKIDTLAISIQRSLVDIEDKIDGLQTDVTGIKQRMTGLENRLDNFVDHERRIVRVEKVLKLA